MISIIIRNDANKHTFRINSRDKNDKVLNVIVSISKRQLVFSASVNRVFLHKRITPPLPAPTHKGVLCDPVDCASRVHKCYHRLGTNTFIVICFIVMLWFLFRYGCSISLKGERRRSIDHLSTFKNILDKFIKF